MMKILKAERWKASWRFRWNDDLRETEECRKGHYTVGHNRFHSEDSLHWCIQGSYLHLHCYQWIQKDSEDYQSWSRWVVNLYFCWKSKVFNSEGNAVECPIEAKPAPYVTEYTESRFENIGNSVQLMCRHTDKEASVIWFNRDMEKINNDEAYEVELG